MYALANKDVVALRTQPSEQASLTDEVLYGMKVEIIEGDKTSDWCLVRTHYQYEGYCRRQDLFVCHEASDWNTGIKKVVMRPYIDILSEPRVQGICRQSIPRGGLIKIKGNVADKMGWVEVELVDGSVGFTKESFLDTYYESMFTKQEALFRKRVVEIAKLYLGTQYRWGGKSPLGIDCSGLTSMCYMLCGVVIYRDAQIKSQFPVHEIAFADKKAGDLLYFPGHIAMYIGEDCYIHATGMSGSDGVVINSLQPQSPIFREDLANQILCTGSIF